MYAFEFNERLGIALPVLNGEFSDLPPDERERLIHEWETIRVRIPDRILQLDEQIMALQEKVSQTDDWDTVCALYRELAELASRINDLHLWYRTQPELDDV